MSASTAIEEKPAINSIDLSDVLVFISRLFFSHRLTDGGFSQIDRPRSSENNGNGIFQNRCPPRVTYPFPRHASCFGGRSFRRLVERVCDIRRLLGGSRLLARRPVNLRYPSLHFTPVRIITTSQLAR